MFTIHNRYFASTAFDGVLKGSNAANKVVEIYFSIIKIIRSVALLMLLWIVFGLILLPVMYLFAFWLYRKRVILVKLMNERKDDFNNVEQYKNSKEKLEKLSKYTSKVNMLAEFDLKKCNLFIRYPISQIKSLSSTILTYEGWLKSNLIKYNKEQFHSEKDIFLFKPEDELWENRNKAYNYWM